jgi:hypothetical protein
VREDSLLPWVWAAGESWVQSTWFNWYLWAALHYPAASPWHIVCLDSHAS